MKGRGFWGSKAGKLGFNVKKVVKNFYYKIGEKAENLVYKDFQSF